MRLQVIQGDDRQEPIEIGEGQTIALGRSPDCDVVFSDRHVSRRHCSISCSNGRVTLEDQGSKTGTFVNRVRIEKQDLQHLDKIKLANIELQFVDDQHESASRANFEDNNEPQITLQLRNLEDSDEEAARVLWEQYYPRLVEFAHRKLGSLPRRTADEEDVAVSAMNSLFCGIEEGKLLPANRDELAGLLFTIAKRKIRAERRRQTAQKRGGGQIRGESIFVASDPQGNTPGLSQVQGHDTGWDNANSIWSHCHELLEALGDERLQKAALLRIQGYSNQEIATEFDVSLSYVNQWFAKIKEIWSESSEGQGD